MKMKNIGLLGTMIIFSLMLVMVSTVCQATETTAPDITLNQVGSNSEDLRIFVNRSFIDESSCTINVTVEDKDEERMGRDIHLHEDRNKIVNITNTIYFCKFTAPETGNYYNISAWIIYRQQLGNRNHIKAAVYTDSNGPDDLLSETNELDIYYWPNLTNRWLNFRLNNPVTLQENTDYWLAILSDGAFITYNKTATTNQVAYILNNYEDDFPKEISTTIYYKSNMILDIYANMTKTASGIGQNSVKLQWYNGNSWDSDVSMTQAGGYYEITKSGLSSGNWYSFNVTAEDDDYNQRKYTFTRYSPEINDSSRIFFQCGCANNPYKYNSDYIFYINNASYETPKTDIVGDYGENQVNALRHGQGTNGTLQDTG